jgi:RNA recognition motif-containing protein
MAASASGYNLGDISSLLFNTSATSALQSKKKKSAPGSESALNPFAVPSNTSPSPFAEAARAQIVVASQLQADKSRGHQSKKSKAETSDFKADHSTKSTESLAISTRDYNPLQIKSQKKLSTATDSSPADAASDPAPSTLHATTARIKSADGSTQKKLLQGKMPQNGVVNGVVFKNGQRVTSLEVSPRVPTGERITDPDKDARTVFVGNVPVAIKLKHIKRHFSPCGTVESVRLRSLPVASPKLSRKGAYATKDFREGASSCNAYVVFSEAASVPAALKLNGSELGGHHVRVDTVGSGTSAQKFNNRLSLFVGNLDYRVNEEALHAHFSAVAGDGVVAVRCIRDKSTSFGKGFAYVHFNSVDALSAALKLDGKVFEGRALRVSRSDGKASLKRSRPIESAKSSSASRQGPSSHSPQKHTQPPRAISASAPVTADTSPAKRLKKPRHVPRPGATQPTLPPRASDNARAATDFAAKSRSRKVNQLAGSAIR